MKLFETGKKDVWSYQQNFSKLNITPSKKKFVILTIYMKIPEK